MNDPPESDDEVLDTGARHRANRRVIAVGAAAAAVVVGVAVALRSGGGRSTPAADPTSSTVSVEPTPTPTSTAPPPPQPVFGTVTPTAPAPVTGPLDMRLCPRHRTCTNPPTSTDVRAGIQTAIRAVYGAPSALQIRNVVLDADGGSGRRPLFAREISARTRFGRLDVRAAAVSTENVVPSPDLVASTGLDVQFYGYVVNGELAARGNPDPVLVSQRMETLLYDPRLLVGP